MILSQILLENSDSQVNQLINILKRKLSKIKYGLRDPKTNKQWKRWNEEQHRWEATLYDYNKVWRLATAEETIISGIGICWDTVELIRVFLTKYNVEFKMFYSHTMYEDPTHTYVIYKDNNIWKWIEHSWDLYRNNNYKFKTWMDGALFINKVLQNALDSKHSYKTYLLNKYPTPGCTSSQFIRSCIHQKRII